jgi:hypothetical protein
MKRACNHARLIIFDNVEAKDCARRGTVQRQTKVYDLCRDYFWLWRLSGLFLAMTFVGIIFGYDVCRDYFWLWFLSGLFLAMTFVGIIFGYDVCRDYFWLWRLSGLFLAMTFVGIIFGYDVCRDSRPSYLYLYSLVCIWLSGVFVYTYVLRGPALHSVFN